jgi:hypothetical protein
MTDRFDKARVLADIDQAWNQYWQRITATPKEDMTQLADDRGWTARDHIDHVTAWEASMTSALRGRPRYEGMGVSVEVSALDFDDENEKIREARAEASLEDVLAESERGHRDFLAAIAALPADGLDRPYGSYVPDAPVETRDEPVLERVLGNSVEHYPEHLAYIEAIVARRENVAD